MSSLKDKHGRTHSYLRLSVTDSCNLNCIYCRPSGDFLSQSRGAVLTNEEMIRLVKLFADMGVNKVRLTGGEPLMRKDIPILISQLIRIDGIRTVVMTTNGVLLGGMIDRLRSAGLNRINISLDTLRPKRFPIITGRSCHKKVIGGIDAALSAGYRSLKINTVVMRGFNDDEILDFVRFVRDRPICVRFIEYMPFRDNSWSRDMLVSFDEMRSVIESVYPLHPVRPMIGDPSTTAKEFRIDGFTGTVGFITSMSDHFCHNCNRIRLTADGYLKTCLFRPAEVNLRDLILNDVDDQQLRNVVRDAISRKPPIHPIPEQLTDLNDRLMVGIGG